MRTRVLRVVGQVLGVPVGELDERSSPDTIESWDSLNHMNVILALEEEFGVRFNDDRIAQVVTVGAMLDALVELTRGTDHAG
jgi:acyl carrier protein